MKIPAYLDYAATTPMAPEAVDAMLPYLTSSGNFANAASGQHSHGQNAASAIDNARSEMACGLRCNSKDIIFTSGATESNNLAINGFMLGYRNLGNHIVTSAYEHKSVLDCCRHLESQGIRVTYLRPGSDGLLTIDSILNALTDETALVSLMHVNNETGIMQDIERIAHALKAKGIAFHVDAAQSAGKVPIDLSSMPIDLLSLSAHKFHGPKGIGCLYVRNRKQAGLRPLLYGGGQEYGLRPGTLPTHQIVSMAAAFSLACERQEADAEHCRQLRQTLRAVLGKLDGVHWNGGQNDAIPHIVNVSFDGVGADALLIALRDSIAISSGSACNSGAIEPSHVLRAMGIEGDRLYGAVRISFGRYTTADEIEQGGQSICEAVIRLRKLASE
ncbi:MAG: cysteine desulfurase family protein [Methylovulum sp.]|nr:cysteine desulfurase family protein [Methylovulum sp.]MDD5126010.1 cysteine desulfurase family protein [Methylovulum sp.]